MGRPKKIRHCEYCKGLIEDRHNKRFCSSECSSAFRKEEHYKKYLADNSIAYGNQHMRHYKEHFLKEQSHKCLICGIKDEWNGKKLVFVLDHIDGNSDNNDRCNLRMVCPNCDSQLDTFKSKNKNSARRRYRK